MYLSELQLREGGERQSQGTRGCALPLPLPCEAGQRERPQLPQCSQRVERR